MWVFEATNPNKIYKTVLNTIIHNGKIVKPRNQVTYELQPVIHEIKNSKNKLCTVPGRKANPFFNIAENMWIIGGHGDSEWISSFNSKLNEYQLDEGQKDFNAPYGRRMRFYNRTHHKKIKLNPYNEINVTSLPQVDQLQHCYQSLKKDKDSRQAVITLWNPLFDYEFIQTKDRPCNTTIYFKIREDKLNMTVSNRSNDLHLGLYGVNFVQFAQIQEFLAAALDVGIGHYIHLSDSLHVYQTSEKTTDILSKDYDFDVYDFCDAKTLSFKEVENYYKAYSKDFEQKVDMNLGNFINFSDCVISDSIAFRDFINSADYNKESNHPFFEYRPNYSKMTYAYGLWAYLACYDLYKMGHYMNALKALECVRGVGFTDLYIAGLEFLNRSEKVRAFIKENNIKNFLCDDPKILNESVMKYIENH